MLDESDADSEGSPASVPSADVAVLYLTFNGVCNNTNGIGRQTKTLLSILSTERSRLRQSLGRTIDVHLGTPACGRHTWDFSPGDWRVAERVIAGWGGRVWSLGWPTEQGFWSLPAWTALCVQAAQLIRVLTDRYRRLIILAIDTPFLGVAGSMLQSGGIPDNARIALVPYSTRLIVEREAPTPAHVAWERDGLAAADGHSVVVAAVGSYIRKHLAEEYGVAEDHFVPYRSALHVESPEFLPHPDPSSVLLRYAIPLDRPIVLALGRDDPTKGLDLLPRALRRVASRIHLVLIVVPQGQSRETVRQQYEARLSTSGVRSSLVIGFNRELPHAVASSQRTAAVVCPSRGETLSNVPFEVALWARAGGPIVVCPAIDGFVEQVDAGITGYLYDPSDPEALATAVEASINLPAEVRRRMAAAAAARVLQERDAVASFAAIVRQMSRD